MKRFLLKSTTSSAVPVSDTRASNMSTMAELWAKHQDSLEMYEFSHEIKTPAGILPNCNNLSVSYSEARSQTYVAVASKNQVLLGKYDAKSESHHSNWEWVNMGDLNLDRYAVVLQTVLLTPNIRALPLLIIATTVGTMIYCVRTQRLLHQCKIPEQDAGTDVAENPKEWYSFCRGVAVNDNTILVGTHTGDILQFVCTSETHLQTKKPLQQHNYAIMDIATCKYDEITCSADSKGDIIIWQKPLKGVQFKIHTELAINVINVLRKQVIVGANCGILQFYSITSGDLMAQVNAHSRSITSVSVAPESAYVMSSSEDGRFIVYKLHTRKPNAYQVEYRFSTELESQPIIGAEFTNGRGSHIAVCCYDTNRIKMYRIMKRTTAPA